RMRSAPTRIPSLSLRDGSLHREGPVIEPWWQGGVLYQVYPRSFADSNGDGIGDLEGVTSRLEHLEWLGVDAIWLNPIYPSPNVDWGYGVADSTAGAGTCTTSRASSPTSTGGTRRCARSSSASFASGSTAVSRASGSTSPMRWSRTGSSATTWRRRTRTTRTPARTGSAASAP